MNIIAIAASSRSLMSDENQTYTFIHVDALG